MSDSQPFVCLKQLALENQPHLVVALGSGLGPVAGGLQALLSVPFSEIAGLSAPSVPGHKGCLTLTKWGRKSVIVLEGRLHSYEGHTREIITQPIHIAHSLGARIFLSTNAAGGIDPRLHPGSFMVIRDHIDWTRPFAGRAWTVAASGASHGPGEATGAFTRPARQKCFQPAHEPHDSTSPYSSRLLDLIQESASSLKMDVLSGTYAAVVGPNYETPAEIRALRHCGADAVGMSTAQEIQAAHDLGMECAAISCITNRAAGLDQGAAITHDEVLHTAKAASRQLARLIEVWIENIK